MIDFGRDPIVEMLERMDEEAVMSRDLPPVEADDVLWSLVPLLQRARAEMDYPMLELYRSDLRNLDVWLAQRRRTFDESVPMMLADALNHRARDIGAGFDFVKILDNLAPMAMPKPNGGTIALATTTAERHMIFDS